MSYMHRLVIFRDRLVLDAMRMDNQEAIIATLTFPNSQPQAPVARPLHDVRMTLVL
jgi:hypothetical protein